MTDASIPVPTDDLVEGEKHLPTSEETDMDVLTGRIVVRYDGSQHSGAAVDWAAAEAQRRGVRHSRAHRVER